MKTRSLGSDDAEAWWQMRCALWPDADEAELKAEVTAYADGAYPLVTVLVCEDGPGRLVGMLELSLRSHAEGCRASPVPYVEGWYVLPGARRRGVGRALIAAAERWARERGYAELASDTLLDNDLGRRAHLGAGFGEVERTIHFRKSLDDK